MHCRDDVGLDGDVADDTDHFDTRCRLGPDLLGGGVEPCQGPPTDRHVGAVTSESQRAPEPDPAAATGDQHRQALEPTTARYLVHGSPGGPSSWRRVTAELDANYPDITYETIAIPGWERTVPGDVEPLSYDQLVEALAAQMPVERPTVLVGFSAGGLFSLSLTARGRGNVQRLVLIDPMLFPLLPLAGFEAEHTGVLSMLHDYVAAVDAGDATAFERVTDVWIGPGAYQLMPPRGRDYLNAAGPLNARDTRATMAASFPAEEFGHVHCRVLAMWGGAGPGLWQRFTDSLHHLIPHAETRCFEGANHDILTTHPAEVAALIAAAAGTATARR